MKAVRHYLLLLLSILACSGHAAFEQSAGDYLQASNATLQTETWLYAATITLLGTADDDLFLLSNPGASAATTNATPTIRLGGVMQGDVWALGDDIELTGTTRDHVRLAGLRTVHVTGSVGRNLTVIANAVHLDAPSAVTGDVVVLARDVIAEGRVTGNATFRAQKVVLGGHIAGDVAITAASITIRPDTEIGGNLTYLSDGADLVLDPRVKVTGQCTRLAPPPAVEASRFDLGALMLQLGLFLGALLAALLLFGLLPAFAFASVDRLNQSVWRALLIGFAACALIPMTAVLLMFTLVGIPLGIMLLLVYTLLLYFGKAIAAFHLAHLLIRRLNPAAPQSLMPVLALGLVLIYTAVNLPFPLGTVAWFAFTFMGVGAMVITVLDRRVPVLAMVPPGGPAPLPGREAQ
jgi:cytoskeletal protein CcmA (bactofilin family)